MVHRIYSAIDKTKPGKPTMMKQSNLKFNIIAMEELNCLAFICEWLKVWDLDMQYSLVLSKGFRNPRGTQVRVWRVGVRVGNV